VVNATPRPLYARERDKIPIVQEAGWAPGPVSTGKEKSHPYRDSIPGLSNPQQVPIPSIQSRHPETIMSLDCSYVV